MNGIIQRFISAAIVAAIFVEPARAADGGRDSTLGLGEVLVAVAKSPELAKDIQHELDSNNLKADAVTCATVLYGEDWKYLAGTPVPYYYCQIGRRTVWITCPCTYFDPTGAALGDGNQADRSRAKTFQDDKWDWFWTDP